MISRVLLGPVQGVCLTSRMPPFLSVTTRRLGRASTQAPYTGKKGGTRAEVRGKQSIDSIESLNLLDSHISTKDLAKGKRSNAAVVVKGKLGKGLTTPQRPIIDDASQGVLEATSEDIADILNELLSNIKCADMLKGVMNTGDVVEIVGVKLDHDFTHAQAYWHSAVLQDFVQFARRKRGDKYADGIAGKIVHSLGRSFREREGLFRSTVMMKMNFKRVPRISFQPRDPTFRMAMNDGSNDGNSGKNIGKSGIRGYDSSGQGYNDHQAGVVANALKIPVPHQPHAQ